MLLPLSHWSPTHKLTILLASTSPTRPLQPQLAPISIPRPVQTPSIQPLCNWCLHQSAPHLAVPGCILTPFFVLGPKNQNPWTSPDSPKLPKAIALNHQSVCFRPLPRTLCWFLATFPDNPLFSFNFFNLNFSVFSEINSANYNLHLPKTTPTHAGDW